MTGLWALFYVVADPNRICFILTFNLNILRIEIYSQTVVVLGGMMSYARILIADDEPLILSALTGFLVDQVWDVETVNDGRSALNRILSGAFDIAVLDIQMPHLDGLEVLDAVVKKKVNTGILILTAFGSIPLAVEAVQRGAKDFVQKPIQKEEFVAKLELLIQDKQPVTTHVLAERLDAYLKANLINKELSMQVLIDHFGLSKSYIAKLFKEMGTSFSKQLTQHRISKARKLLLGTNEPIYVIADLCGFKNQSRLSESFLRVTGESPRHFRQRERSNS